MFSAVNVYLGSSTCTTESRTSVGWFINMQIIVRVLCAGVRLDSIHSSEAVSVKSKTSRNTEARLSSYGVNEQQSVGILTLQDFRASKRTNRTRRAPFAQSCGSAQRRTTALLPVSYLRNRGCPLGRMSVALG
jgi:hypothetical protein